MNQCIHRCLRTLVHRLNGLNIPTGTAAVLRASKTLRRGCGLGGICSRKPEVPAPLIAPIWYHTQIAELIAWGKLEGGNPHLCNDPLGAHESTPKKTNQSLGAP